MPYSASPTFCAGRSRDHGSDPGGRDELLGDFGRRLTKHADDHHESAFLFQRISTLIQRFDALAVLGTFVPTTPEEDV